MSKCIVCGERPPFFANGLCGPCSTLQSTITGDEDDEPITITCGECGWKSDPFINSTIAFKGAQEHEDVEHEGSKIKWEYVH